MHTHIDTETDTLKYIQTAERSQKDSGLYEDFRLRMPGNSCEQVEGCLDEKPMWEDRVRD